MTSTISEFEDILDVEMLVDIPKLKSSSKFGIPDKIRGQVWKYLLFLLQPEKSQELSTQKTKKSEYLKNLKLATSLDATSLKRIRGESGRYQKSRHNAFAALTSNALQVLKPSLSPPSDNFSTVVTSLDNAPPLSALTIANSAGNYVSNTLENVLSVYLYLHRDKEYTADLIYLCGPFLYALGGQIANEWEIFGCFENFLGIFDDLQSVYTPSQTHTLFLTLFRTLLPDLYAHFEDEDVISDNNSSWSYLWITGLLAKELPIECVARLWDTYFSIDVNFFGDLHVYVCLAILSFLKDNLEELEQSEISGTLGRLPLLDMDHVIGQAFNIRNEVRQRGLVETY